MLPLTRLILSLIGFLKEDRKYIQKLSLKNGASYHRKLTKKISHLIAILLEGLKYKTSMD